MTLYLVEILSRQLIGKITENIKGISIQEKNSDIYIYYYFQHDPEEFEINMLKIACLNTKNEAQCKNCMDFFITLGSNNTILGCGEFVYLSHGMLAKLIPETNKDFLIAYDDIEGLLMEYSQKGTPIPFNRNEYSFVELVDFKKFIGFVYLKDEDIYIPTNFGEIRYLSNGKAHVMPCLYHK